jgi:hypothetical protein
MAYKVVARAICYNLKKNLSGYGRFPRRYSPRGGATYGKFEPLLWQYLFFRAEMMLELFQIVLEYILYNLGPRVTVGNVSSTPFGSNIFIFCAKML